ncbi:hypothetical protein [Halobacterium hubeiense]|uniref:hypothetical protein n=1 Tax=Halobacterium hubeiense TaxID=1407499 RepID=UPI003C775B1A
MPTRARDAAVLALVAAVLLANPLYVPVLPADDSRSANVYSATTVDPAQASDHATIVRAVGEDDVVELAALTDEHAGHAGEYRRPVAAAVLLERAIEAGNATASDAETAFTLHRVTANYRYAVTDFGAGPRYYHIKATASDGTTTVSAAAVDGETVAQHLIHRDAVRYSSLPERQRAAVDAVLADPDSHRPAHAGVFGDLTERVVAKDESYHVLEHEGHVDSIGGSPFGGPSVLLTGLGALAFLAALVLTVRSYSVARD